MNGKGSKRLLNILTSVLNYLQAYSIPIELY